MNVFGLTVSPWLVLAVGLLWAWLTGYIATSDHEREACAASFICTLMSALVLLLLLVLSAGVLTVARAVTGG